MGESTIPEWMVIEQIQKQKHQDTLEAQKMKMDKKAELLVLERRRQVERGEAEMEELLDKEQHKAVATAAKREYDEKIAAEMSRLRRDELRDQKIREQLAESSEELKMLKSKLRAGYVSKQQLTQVAEKEAAVQQEQLEKHRIQEMIEAERRCMEEQDSNKEESSLATKLKYKEELLNQMNGGNRKQKEAERALEIEKVLLEQSLRKFREEEEMEKATRLEKMRLAKAEIEEFQRQKEIRRISEKAAREEEEKRINAYLEERDNKERKILEELKEKEITKQKIRDKMELAYLSQIQTSQEKEEVWAALAEEEVRQRDIQRDREKTEAAEKLKGEFQKEYENKLREKEKMWQDDYQEQELYRKQILDELAKEEMLSKASAANKALKGKELLESLKRQMEDNHRRQVEEWQRDSAQHKLLEVEEKERIRIVEEERLRMLQTHADKLVGYLPRGILREDDLKHLGPEFLEKFCKHKALNSV